MASRLGSASFSSSPLSACLTSAVAAILWMCAPADANQHYYWYGNDDSGNWDYLDYIFTPLSGKAFLNWKVDSLYDDTDALVYADEFDGLPKQYDYVHIADIDPDHTTIYLNNYRRDIASLMIDTPEYFNISGSGDRLYIHQFGITQNYSPESSANHLISADVILTNDNVLPYQTIDLEESESFLHISGVLTVFSPLRKIGPGELVLSNPGNSIGGKITIAQGSIRIAPTQPDTYVIDSDISLQSNATLEIDNDVTSDKSISYLYGNIDVQSGHTFHVQGGFNGDVATVTGGGTLRVDGGMIGSPLSNYESLSPLTLNNSTLELGGSAPTAKIITQGDATIRAVDDGVSIYHVVPTSSAATTIDTNGHDMTVTWIGDASGMTKTGAGTLTTHTVRLGELRILGGTFHPVYTDISPLFDVDRVVLDGGELSFSNIYNHTETAQLDVEPGGGTLRIDTPTDTTWAGDFDDDSSDGTLTKAGGATLILTGGGAFFGDLNVAQGKLVLDRSTWTRGGAMYVQNGAELEVAAADQFVEGTNVALNGGTLRLDASTFRLGDVTLRAGTITGPGTFEVTEAGSINAPADSGQSVINAPVHLVSPYDYIASNQVTFDVGQDASLLVNAPMSGSNTKIAKTGAGTLTLAGDVTGTLFLNVTDSGTLRLQGANVFTGGRMDSGLTDGAIVLANPLALRTTLGAFDFIGGTIRLEADNVNLPRMNLATMYGRTILDLNGHGAYPGGGAISGPGHLIVTGAGELSFAGLPYANTHGGFIVQNGATLRIDHANQLGAAPDSYQLSNLQLNSGTLDIAGDVTVNANRGFYLIGDNHIRTAAGHTATLHNVIASYADPRAGGSLIVDGPGTLVLTAANTYSGDTTVTGGTLVVANITDSGTGTGDVNVTNASLLNNGTIAGDVLLTDSTLSGNGEIDGQLYSFNSTLSPGNSIGVISVHGGLSLTGTGELLIDLDPQNVQGDGLADLIQVEGTVNLNVNTAYPAVQLILNLLSAPALGQQFTIIENDGTDAIINAALGDDEPIFNRYFYADFDGQTYRFAIDYRSGPAGPSGYGNDVVLTTLNLVPEPTAGTIVAAALLMLAVLMPPRRRTQF